MINVHLRFKAISALGRETRRVTHKKQNSRTEKREKTPER